MKFSSKKYLLILFFGIIGFALPMIYGYANGFPTAHISDEFSYILAADTFANGRLTNPTPALWKHFESPHILIVPSYASKYPPMQGLFLAAGQILFGQPIFGVWLSCGFATAALFWMLLAWTRFNWAILGTILMILLIGINSYWAQSYWGGMAAAGGGALFFGGFRRLFKKLSFGSTSLMILGGVILANSRPFEGFLTLLPSLFVLLVWLCRNKENSVSAKLLQVILPGVLITGISLTAMFYYNYKVTGDWSNMPYAEHQKQYYPTPLFIFQQRDESATNGIEKVRKVYDGYTIPSVLTTLYQGFNVPSSIYLRPFLAFILLGFFIPYFFLFPPLSIIFYVTVPFLISKNRWSALICGTILFTFACMSLATWWDNYHYSASLTCCFYLLLVQGFQYFAEEYKRQQNDNVKKLTLTLLILLTFISIIYSELYPNTTAPNIEDTRFDVSYTIEQLSTNKPVKIPISKRATFYKDNIERTVNNLDGKFIAIVSYSDNCDFNEELVYNTGNLEKQKLIWSHDLGFENNKELLKHFSGYKVLMISISDSEIEIVPLTAK